MNSADVAELADALDSKSSIREDVWVRPPPSAPCSFFVGMCCDQHHKLAVWPRYDLRKIRGHFIVPVSYQVSHLLPLGKNEKSRLTAAVIND